MLFDSYAYIFVFFPLAVSIYFLFSNRGCQKSAHAWLILTSLFFLGWDSLLSVAVLVCSGLVNYVAGSLLISNEMTERRKKATLAAGVVFNIFLLSLFKYHDFFLPSLANRIHILSIGIPLAISFYTFQQIAFLVDAYRERISELSLFDYCLFITFFPRILMGPICRYQDIMPQFAHAHNKRQNYENFALGLYLFFIGLCKCVLIADSFGVYADYGYASVESLTFCEAWITTLSYTFQIYFDFSGYTDMAIGSAYFFNIRLPVNFNSPYLSLNIQEFWRRWHITLSRFLRDYLYIPLGGSRGGFAATQINILMTFAIGGLWHGAGWTFIVWGLLHGLALVVFRFWQRTGLRMPKLVALMITFNFVNLAWIFFRSKDLRTAYDMLTAMSGGNEFWGMLAFGSIEFLDKITGLVIALISIASVFFAKNTNAIPETFHASPRQLAQMVAVMILGIFFLNSVLPKGFLYLDF